MKRKKPETSRNEIKSCIVRSDMTMSDVVGLLSGNYGWHNRVANLSGKRKRGSVRYGKAAEPADAPESDLIGQKRREVR